jgi:hypothetical protein
MIANRSPANITNADLGFPNNENQPQARGISAERYLGTKQDLVHAPNDGIKLRVAHEPPPLAVTCPELRGCHKMSQKNAPRKTFVFLSQAVTK